MITFNQLQTKDLCVSQPSNLYDVSCGFWHLESQQWSDEGCLLNFEQSNSEETVRDCFNLKTILKHHLKVCDCSHLTSFNLFMDWTGKCFGLPSSPALDIITKVPSLHLQLIILSSAIHWLCTTHKTISNKKSR